MLLLSGPEVTHVAVAFDHVIDRSQQDVCGLQDQRGR